ncbi:MAG: hypothetical protein WC360_09755, partial [Opitutales bacterium]
MRPVRLIIFLLCALATTPLGVNAQVTDLPPEAQALREAAGKALADSAQPPSVGLNYYGQIASMLSASHDTEKARVAYMAIISELAAFSVARNEELVPPQMLENALSLAKSDANKALVHFLTAWRLADDPDAFQRARAGAEFAQADKLESVDMKAEMLFRYARWAERDGYSTVMDNGEIQTGADYEKALALYVEFSRTSIDQELVKQALAASERIRKASVSLEIANSFRPGSQPQMQLDWRNCDQVDISIYPLDLDKLSATGMRGNLKDWIGKLAAPDGMEPVRRLTFNTRPTRPYYNVSQPVRLDDLLLPGAYLVSAVSGNLKSNDMLLVTDSILTLKISRKQVLAFACNAITGKPVSGAALALWVRNRDDGSAVWFRTDKKTSDDGVAMFAQTELNGLSDMTRCEVLAFLIKDQQQAVAYFKPDSAVSKTDEAWTAALFLDGKIHAPGQTVHIASLIRRREGSSMTVPQGASVSVEMTGPDGFG